MTRDHGHVVKVALETDSVSGRGTSPRLGARNGRHVDTQWLWVQAVVRRREAAIRRVPGTSNEADFVTTLLGGRKIQEIVQHMGYHYTEGRSQSALKAAPDGLGRVDSDRQ